MGIEKKKGVHIIKNVLAGTFLEDPVILKQLRFFLFLCFLGFLYIRFTYMAEHNLMTKAKLQKQIKELRYESVSLSSELMYSSNRTEVLKLIEEYQLDLEESVLPPKKIVVKKDR